MLDKIPTSPRAVYLWIAFLCTALIAIAIYLQVVHGLDPCPLCVLQRMVFLCIGLVGIFASLLTLKKAGHLFFGGLVCGLSIVGLGLASRQLWLQWWPTHTPPACGAGLSYMLHTLPFLETVKIIFSGTADCAKVGDRIFFLTVPEWSFLFFSLILILGIIQIVRAKKPVW